MKCYWNLILRYTTMVGTPTVENSTAGKQTRRYMWIVVLSGVNIINQQSKGLQSQYRYERVVALTGVLLTGFRIIFWFGGDGILVLLILKQLHPPLDWRHHFNLNEEKWSGSLIRTYVSANNSFHSSYGWHVSVGPTTGFYAWVNTSLRGQQFIETSA